MIKKILKKKPYLIAEIGVNHNGKLPLAIRSIKEAAIAGADAVKFQIFKTEEFMSENKINYTYKTYYGSKSEDMFKMFKRLEFSKSWIKQIQNTCKKYNVDFLSSVADKDAALFMKKINIKTLKLSSEDLINYPLLEFVAKLNLNIILSTGMANEEEISKALSIFKKRNVKVILLHCVSLYPTELKNANLNRMIKLREKYNVPTGYSDHTLGIESACVAASLGAVLIEKHFTLDKKLTGPDHMMSADTKEFKKLANELKKIRIILGDGRVKPHKKEQIYKKIYRRSITAIKGINKGDKFTNKNISLLRPADGIHPKYLKSVLGKKSNRNILNNEKIKFKDIYKKN